MAAKQEDHWSSEAYQNSASFVPKLAGKILGWLDVEPDDLILDVGCGDGVINLQIAEVLQKGKGKITGIDSSESMIAAATKAAKDKGVDGICGFEVIDATTLLSRPELQRGLFDKVFSNAAMHWILRPPSTRESFFRGILNTLKPSGIFVFEMGGFGNVPEMRTALLSVIGRRVGIKKAREVDPWFFPDEKWVVDVMGKKVGGWKVERCEREWRPTKADVGGVEAWVRLMGKQFFDVLAEGDREGAIKEVVEVLESVTGGDGVGDGGDYFGYVRLRVLARKL